MKFTNTYGMAAIIAGSIFFGTTSSSFAGPSNGSNLGECYNNWISWCNEHTAGYPNSCYGESMDHCDGVHSANMTQIPGYKVKSMKTQALRKAKRTDVRVIAPATPVRRAN